MAKRDWAGDAAKAVQAEKKVDWSILREWFPMNAMLRVMNTTDQGDIIVRWQLESDPGMTHEAILRMASCVREKR